MGRRLSPYQWYPNLAYLFGLGHSHHSTVAIDETKLNIEATEVYVWAALDVEIFEVIHIEVSPSRFDLDALLFIKHVLKRCRGDPVVFVDRGCGTTGRLRTSISVSHAEKRWTHSRRSLV